MSNKECDFSDPVAPPSPVAMSDSAPEGCCLVAHDTGDGWALAVEDSQSEIVAYLAWPDCFGESQTAEQLRTKGFIIV